MANNDPEVLLVQCHSLAPIREVRTASVSLGFEASFPVMTFCSDTTEIASL
jgi:hypothetical protein